MRLLPLLALAGALVARPAIAEVSPGMPAAAVPLRQLSDAEAAGARQVLASIRASDWTAAAQALDGLPPSPVASVLRAELYAAKGAPLADPAVIAALLATAPDLPQAPALARLALSGGATTLPPLPVQHALVRVRGASKRVPARSTRSDAAAQTLALQVQPLLKAGDVAAAEPLVEDAAGLLTPEALTEWRQKIAWGHFQNGDDPSARRVAELARAAAGDWAVEAAWVAGLSAWRAADYAAAADAFDTVAQRAGDSETIAAGLFWAARSDTAGGHPDAVQARLRSAGRYVETFYGLLANASLGIASAAMTDPAAADTQSLLRHANLRAAAGLSELGETTLADQLVRQQALIGSAAEHPLLIAFAGKLGLPATQLWLAQNAPAGAQASIVARYPMPAWAPSGGWRVDRALIYAHALQESQFRTDAVSRTGARGLMQLMPATARLVARHRGDPADTATRLGEPALNFEYGQSYLEELAGNAGTGGLLPKVVAAYNAGPNNVALWNLKSGVQGDPLLFIESIPFGETRAYVAIVLRNYWMYQRETGAATPSLTALATGQWPRFPRAADRTIASAGGAAISSTN